MLDPVSVCKEALAYVCLISFALGWLASEIGQRIRWNMIHRHDDEELV
jgi:hypothetical protein